MDKNSFAEMSKDLPPTKVVTDALPFVKEKGVAFDIGAGSLRNSKFLIKAGFKKVVALDKDLTDVQDENIEFIQTDINEYVFPENEIDLIVSINTLPFLSKEQFKIVFPKIIASLKDGGVLCASLFGINDTWSVEETMHFHTKESVMELLEDFSLKIFIEEESEGQTIQGAPKHWHVFRFVVVK